MTTHGAPSILLLSLPSPPNFPLSLPIFFHSLSFSFLILTPALSFPMNATSFSARASTAVLGTLSGIQTARSANFNHCHTCKIIAAKSFPCHTYKNKGLITSMFVTHPKKWGGGFATSSKRLPRSRRSHPPAAYVGPASAASPPPPPSFHFPGGVLKSL